jgi:UDP-N-acetylmuramate--alanine ligase
MLLEPQPILPVDELGAVHFIAIGGAGMSGVAQLYLELGRPVSGSDQADSPELGRLAAAGAEVWVGHDASRLGPVDTVVVSTAIPPDNVELVEARRRGLRIWHRSTALAALTLGSATIAVAGTHGKTTTSAMIVRALNGAGLDPSYVIGARLAETGQSAHLGRPAPDRPAVFVVEADESDGSFLQYPSQIQVVPSVEADHLDNWGSAEAYRAGFERFVRGPSVTQVICSGDEPGAAALAQGLAEESRPVWTYGESAGCRLRLSQLASAGLDSSAWLRTPDWSGRLRLAVPGRHNLHNAAAAVAAGLSQGCAAADLVGGLADFRGAGRRFELVGRAGGVTVYDDYAHHPTEVAVTLAAAREVAAGARLVALFQPHLFTRTRDWADQFGAALAAADLVLVCDVYPARERPIAGVSGRLVADAAHRHGAAVLYRPSLDQAVQSLADLVRPGDLVLTLGAGDVTTAGPRLLRRRGQA